jgi:glycosyltransferase involved in cell wall biosynthesis
LGVARLRRVPFVFEVLDLWPAVPVALGVLTREPEIRAAEWLERRLYAAAARVVVCSEGMAASLRERGIPERKIVLVPNFADVEHFRPGLADPGFRARHGLDGKFVALYAGAMGISNGVGQLADAAAALREAGDDNVVIAVAGNGTERARLEQQARDLPNLLMLPDVPRDEIPKVVGAADATMTVFAPVRALEVNSPNKFFDSLAAGKPTVVNVNGWLRRLVEENRAGVYAPAGDARALANALRELAANPEAAAEMGRNARALAEREFAASLLADRFADTVEQAAAE